MQTNVADTMGQLGQDAFSSAKGLAEINLRTGEKLFQQQLALTEAWLAIGTRNLELLSKAKGYQELLSGQATLAQECNQQLLDGYQSAAKVVTEATQAYGEWVDDGMKTAAENVKQAAPAKK